MKNRTWNNTFLLGIPIIDRQHEKLFDIYDQLVEMSNLQEKYQNDEMREVLHKLEKFLKVHFQEEEDLLEKSDYPSMEEHKREHGLFIRKIEEFGLAFQADNPELLNSMLDFLKKWLVSHIMQTDFGYKEYL